MLREHVNLDKIPVYTIFILILIISANFLAQLFPCRLQRILHQNIYIKHLFSFLTLFFFVVLTAPIENKSLRNIFNKSLLLYIWFIFIMRTDPYIFILLLFIIGIIYLFFLKESELKEKAEKIQTIKGSEDLKHIENEIMYIRNINQYLFYLTILLTIIGFLLYMGEKKCEYKKKFNYIIFLFGKPVCNNKSTIIDYKKSISCIFD
jgi:hypothetical protein